MVKAACGFFGQELLPKTELTTIFELILWVRIEQIFNEWLGDQYTDENSSLGSNIFS